MGKIVKKKCFTFTAYGINEDESDKLETLVTEDNWAKTIFFTHELGSEGDNPHVQGYIVCHNANSFNTVKNKINGVFNREINPHIEEAKGTSYQNLILVQII